MFQQRLEQIKYLKRRLIKKKKKKKKGKIEQHQTQRQETNP